MRCRLKKVYNKKTWLVEKNLTSLGKDNCDIKVNCKQPGVDRKHAFISVDEENGIFTIKDNNSTNGTFVNEQRIPNKTVRLNHGDVIRLGHGGPQFEVVIEEPRAGNNTNMSNLPTIAVMQTSPSLYTSPHYGKYGSFTSSAKTEKSNVVPHPPVRQRPVSANPASGHFQPLSKPTISGNWTNGFSNNDDHGSNTYDSYTDFDAKLRKSDEKLTSVVNYETECHKKESVIETLREEIDYLRKCTGTASAFTTGCHQKIAALHNQIKIKNEDNETLRGENANLRTENDNLRRENLSIHTSSDIRFENDSLRDENERLKGSTHDINHQVSEMQLLLTQRDHKVALLENELCRMNKEKSQMAVLLNSLQKEITSKDEQLRKTKDEVEKYKVELRNKKNEISTLAARISKNSELKETVRELKQKEEEAGTLKYRVKSLEDKVLSKDTHINDLHDRITVANNKLSETENVCNTKVNELRYQVKTFEDKVRAKDTIVKDLNIKLSETKIALSENEKRQMEKSSHEIEATKDLSGLLVEIEKSLIDHGRSCDNLNDGINRLQFFDASDNLRWVKECFLSYLCQECNWEREIEDALKMVTGDSVRAATPPTLLLQLLHEKLDKHANEIMSLENKIGFSDQEHAKHMEEIKINMKEKYKLKAEKAIKEMRCEEKKNFEEEMQRVREQEEGRLTKALELQKAESTRDACTIQALSGEIHTLQNERNKIKNEFDHLEMNYEQSRRAENEYKEKLDETEKEKIINEQLMEDKVKETASNRNELSEKLQNMEETYKSLNENYELKCFEVEELKSYKEKVNEQAMTIANLEYKIGSLQNRKASIEGKIENLNKLVKEYKENEENMKSEEENATLLAMKVEELININEELKKTAEAVQNEFEEEKSKTKKLQDQLDTTRANLSDLRADLSDKDKQKIEHLEDKCVKQEKELFDQQMHLVKLSTLVDEQKKKLVEQDVRLKEQNNILMDRHIPWASKDSPRTDSSADYPTDLKIVGERCISRKHDEIITEQKSVIKDMHHSMTNVGKTAVAIHRHPHQIVKMSEAIDDLKVELAVQEHQNAVTDQELYDEVCRLQTLLVSANEELTLEQVAHKNNLHALEQCEELYLKFVRDTNKELDIPQILGAKPLSFSLDDERARILTERGKGLEVIVNRIKALKSRIERKDQLLEHYDDDLKNLRDTENYAGKKSYEVKNLQKELEESKNEISYLQEALKKWRSECDDLKRQSNSFKEKKVLMMDYTSRAASLKSKKLKNKQKSLPAFSYSQEGVQDLSC